MASAIEFEAIGTHWHIDVYKALSPEREGALLSAVRERIEQFDKDYSRFRADSLVTRMAQDAGEYRLPDDATPLLTLYHDLYRLTNGLFTPFIGQLLVDAGYDANYTLQQKNALVAPPSWDEVMQYSHPNLRIKKPTLLDVGAAGKGYLVDIIAALLEAEGIKKYCIDAGGDIIHRNDASIRIGLEHPNNLSQIVGVVELQKKSICGSAGNRRKWQDFNHIMNPETRTSVQDIIATWVIADTTMLADALATCLFFVPSTSLDAYTFEYLLIRSDLSMEKSEGFTMD